MGLQSVMYSYTNITGQIKDDKTEGKMYKIFRSQIIKKRDNQTKLRAYKKQH